MWIFFALDKNGQAFYPRTPWTDGSPLTRIKRGTLGMTTKPSNKLESKFELDNVLILTTETVKSHIRIIVLISKKS